MSQQPLDPDSPHIQRTGADPEKNPDPPEVVKEVREVNPFVRMDRGFATVHPLDEGHVIFEDFSPRVVPSDTPDEVVPTIDELIIPKGESVQEPASSSESTSEKETSQAKVENVPTASEPALPAPPLGPLPFPSSKDAEPDAGKLNPTEAG